MVETSSPKPTSKVADNNKPIPPYKVKLVKGAKPLIHHKFYLDIEKYKVANKIENQIKELGGSIEFFLSKDITHFITDKQQTTPTVSLRTSSQNQSSKFSPNTIQHPQTPLSSASLTDIGSVSSPATANETRANSIANNKQISRADAILLRARQSQLQNTPVTQRNREITTELSEKSHSPIQVAKSWGRPIWTAEHALKFLEKVCSALKIYASTTTSTTPAQDIDNNRNGTTSNHRHHKSAKVKSLRGDFIKVETLDKRYRPFYQELKKWPKLNLLTRLTHSPFESELDTYHEVEESQKSKFKKFSKIDSRTNTTSKFKTVGTIMTRKSRPSQQQNTDAGTTTNNTVESRVNNKSDKSDNKHCGYCEICHVEYDVLKVHLKSQEHLNFAKNADNFVALDKLIESGASVQKLLKLSNDVKKETVVNGFLKRSNSKKLSSLRNRESEEESSEECDKNGIVNGSSEGDVIEEPEEDPLSLDSPRPKRKCMQSPTVVKSSKTKRQEMKVNQESHDTNHKSIESKIQATRIRGLRWNAPSPDSRPPIKEPPVYKVDKTPHTKQNTNTNCHTKSSTKVSTNENNAGKQVVVKLKRVRQSELNLLNNEAEQFMFPKTPTFSDSDTDEDRQTSEVNRTNNTTIDLPSSDREVCKKSSTRKSKNVKNQCNLQNIEKKEVASPNSKRINKRLEALIEENSKYTHESLGRLRFQETPIQPQVTVNTATHWLQDDRMGDNSFLKSPGGTPQSRWMNFKKKYQAIDQHHKFNFERVPHNEPWYVTFRRQDVGFERAYEYFGNSTYNKLPYELGPLPPGKEDCCKLEELIPPTLKGLNGSIKKRGNSCPRMPSIAKVNDRTRSSTAAIIEATKVVDANDDTTNDSIKTKLYLPLKKRKLFLDDVPRKSPREHASTLAILSSLSKEGSSTASSICGVNRSGIKRERLPSQLSLEDDDDNSNCTMTSQQTIKTVATEKDNSSVCSITNNNIQNKFVNIIKLCKQVDEMLVSGDGEIDDVFMFDISLSECEADKCEKKPTDDFVLINSKESDVDISEVMDICSTQELTLKSLASKEKEVQRKITYTSKPKLVTSGFRFNKKRRSNRTGWQKIRRKSSQPKDKDDEKDQINTEQSSKCQEDNDKNITPDIFAVSSDSLDTNVVEFMKNSKSKVTNGGLPDIDTENESADEEEERPTVKSPITKPSKPNNVFCRGIGKYQFEKYPKVNLTQINVSNMKTRSSDLQKRKSVTPKKYTDSQNETLRSPGSNSSPQKFSPRKLRKPRGRWYRER